MVSSLIPGSLIKILEEEAQKQKTSPEAVLSELLLVLVPDEKKPSVLLDSANTCLVNAEKLGDEGKIIDGYKRVWSAMTLVLKAYSLKKGVEAPRSLEEMWNTVEEMGKELGEDVYAAFYTALAADIASIEKLEYLSHLKTMIKILRGLVGKLVSIL